MISVTFSIVIEAIWLIKFTLLTILEFTSFQEAFHSVFCGMSRGTLWIRQDQLTLWISAVHKSLRTRQMQPHAKPNPP